MGPSAAGARQTKSLFETADPQRWAKVNPAVITGPKEKKAAGNQQGNASGNDSPAQRDAILGFSGT